MRVVLLACVAGVWSGQAAAVGEPDLVLKNDYIEVGVSKEFGGAITYLALRGRGRNLINNHDKGRQIQQSVYAGEPLDRTAEGQSDAWSPWPWNPVQAGDTYGNKSRILEARSEGNQIYTKVQPMLWDMNNELAEAHYETWITLEGPVVHVRNTVTCFRTDDRWGVEEKDQEIPAAYTIGALDRLYAYTGAQPWTQAPLERLEAAFPWTRRTWTEPWAAFVNADQWGVGIYSPSAGEFLAGFYGTPPGETADAATGYISPITRKALRKDSVFSYEYDIIVGTLEEIRTYVYVQEGKAPATAFQPSPPKASAAHRTLALGTATLLAAGAALTGGLLLRNLLGG